MGRKLEFMALAVVVHQADTLDAAVVEIRQPACSAASALKRWLQRTRTPARRFRSSRCRIRARRPSRPHLTAPLCGIDRVVLALDERAKFIDLTIRRVMGFKNFVPPRL
jgi:hypothetical protein